MKKAQIVMQTDFGFGISVSTMHGVCSMVDPELQVYDSTHDIKNFNTYEASLSLDFVVDYWPAGTVFVSVVDPGVGTSRRACVAKLKNGSYIVTPDNGSLTHVKERVGIEEVRVIDETVNRLKGSERCSIFHGRDLFSYCAAKLAAGVITYEEVGPEYDVNEIITHELVPYKVEENQITGMIASNDYHFGLICSNIPVDVFAEKNVQFGDKVHVIISKKGQETPVFEDDVMYCKAFGDVPEGTPLLMNSETFCIQIAMNYKNMSEMYGIELGNEWLMELTLLK